MFQDYESFSENVLARKNGTFGCLVTSQSPGRFAMRFQRRKLPFACNQRRRTLPVRIAWQGAELGCLIAIREYQLRRKIF